MYVTIQFLCKGNFWPVIFRPVCSHGKVLLFLNLFLKKKVGHSRPLFIYFCLFNTVDNKQMFNKILLMTGVEPRTSGIEIDRSTN